MRTNWKGLLVTIPALLFILFTAAIAEPRAAVDREVPPPASLQAAHGSYYRKAASSFDRWLGITATVTLGQPRVDPRRLDPFGHPRDNFNIYLGGNARGEEIDAGLTWDFGRTPEGKRSPVRNVWRPFWRNGEWHTPLNSPDCAWKPGEKVVVTVIATAAGQLELTVADPGANPRRRFCVRFEACNFGPGRVQQFKRVVSVDQFHNEGKSVQSTASQITGTIWESADLLRLREAKVVSLPMTASRRAELNMFDANVVVSATPEQEAQGGERVDIYGCPSERLDSPSQSMGSRLPAGCF